MINASRFGRLAVSLRFAVIGIALLAAMVALPAVRSSAQEQFHDRQIENIEIVFGEEREGPSSDEVYRTIIRDVIGTTYSIPRIHDSLVAVYRTGNVVSVDVSARENGSSGVDLIYHIVRKPTADKVLIEVAEANGEKVTEEDLRFRLDLLDPGAVYTEAALRKNADQLLDYLRDRGFYRSEVTFEQRPTGRPGTSTIVFDVKPNDQSKVEQFAINIEGLTESIPPATTKLTKGEFYSRETLIADIERIRKYLREKDFFAPELSDPQVRYNSEKNSIDIELTGKVGPTVKVDVVSDKVKVGSSTQNRLLPIKSEGILDYAAIVEGERKLENYFQENGYFFADVTPVCSVDPPIQDTAVDTLPNDTQFLCSVLGNTDLMGRTVEVNYNVDPNRKYRLQSLRIRGTDQLTIDDVRTVLESQEANILGFIPLFGYGRGYTSQKLLETDAATIRSLMNELGYRDATVRVNRGVSLTGDDLIITFVVDEGPPTIVDGVAVTGNSAFTDQELLDLLPDISGQNYSRAKVRNAVRKLAEFYSKSGYFDAHISSSITEVPAAADAEKKEVKVEFHVESEGRKVVINDILVTGNDKTKTQAIRRAITLKSGEYLTSTDIYESEQNLYGTDAFDRVEIKPVPAGDAPSGERASDVIISVNEQPPRLMIYGGGYSTDYGLNGFFDIRHVNLFGNLWQGGARIRWSQRQQLVQFDFIQPRFLRDGKKRFSPLTLTAQYQRDSTVTRFFRSAFDKGTFGIVQRIDENGNPIDIFGDQTGDPTINRLSFTAETSRTISRRDRSIVFARYRFEDVRLSNIDSLLIKDLLIPDKHVRISGFSFTFARDTRRNCAIKYSLLEIIAKGEPGERCRYSSSDPTNGTFLTAEYNVSLPQLGANIGFQKFQASYNLYYSFPSLRNLTIAARGILGLANVFSSGDRTFPAQYADLAGILPISERFFAGGSTTLRGFDFEQAGPRVVIVPQGTFRNSNGDPVFLEPFTVPFGGNALAVVNLEARVPLTDSIRAVPFYDGGNVFRRVGDIFNPPDSAPNDVFKTNIRALWTHTAGIGLRIKTPVGGEFAVDYGYILNPPEFLIPQTNGPNAIQRLHQGQFHFRFSQAF